MKNQQTSDIVMQDLTPLVQDLTPLVAVGCWLKSHYHGAGRAFPDEPRFDALERLRGGKARYRIVLEADFAGTMFELPPAYNLR